MEKYMIIKSYPVSKDKTRNEVFGYVDTEKQADLLVNKIYEKISALSNKLNKKYSAYLHKYPHCKMNKYISGLMNLNFIDIAVPKYSLGYLKDNEWLITDYPKNYDVALDEVRLNKKKLKSHTEN